MRPEGSHLTDEEIDRLIDERDDSPIGSAHAAECALCRDRMYRERVAKGKLLGLTSRGGLQGVGCLSQQEWFEVASGLLPEAQESTALQHATGCDACAVLLRHASRVLTDVSTGAEPVPQLRSNSPRWQRGMARQMRRLANAKHYSGGALKRWMFALGLVAALIAVALLWVVTGSGDFKRAEGLIAQGYQSRRLFEVRLPDAVAAEMAHVTRGSTAEIPGTLHEALGLISKHLEREPNSARWLDLKGRAEMVAGDPDPAVTTLTKAANLAQQGDGQDQTLAAQIKGDLAAALIARADTAVDSGDSSDLYRAQKLLIEALKSNQRDPVALYNKGLVEERLGQWQNAITSFETLLDVEPRGSWAEEVKRKLQRLRSGLALHEMPDVSAAEFNSSGSVRWPEAYLDLAMRHWLFGSGTPAYDGALNRLATEFIDRHGDHWLAALLDQSGTNKAGLFALARAIDANARGDYSKGLQFASRARSLARGHDDGALALRGAFEQVYAEHLLYRGKRCSAGADDLINRLAAHSEYKWLQVQARLEAAVCHNYVGDLLAANKVLEEAQAIARTGGFRVLDLRVLGFRADQARQQGDLSGAWNMCVEGLRRYWTEWAPPLRAHQFLTEMEYIAESTGDWDLALSFQAEAVQTIGEDDDFDYRATAHFRLAKLAVANRLSEVAANEFRTAASLYRQAPDQVTARTHELESRIGLAAVLLKVGHKQESRQNLQEVSPLLTEVDPYFITVPYYQTLGDLEFAQRNWAAAADAYSKGAAIAAAALHDLRSPTERLRWVNVTDPLYRALTEIALKQNSFAKAWELWQFHIGSAVRGASPSRSNVSSVEWPVLITYIQLRDEIGVWVVRSQSVQFHRIETSPERFRSIAARFAAECADPVSSQSELSADARQLYAWLIAPIRDELERPDQRLAVQPDASWPDFPFEALVDDSGKFLAHKYTIAYSPGTEYDATSTGTRIAITDRAVVVDSSRLNLRIPLPGAEQEVRTVRATFPETAILNGNAITAQIVTSALRHAHVFHFAGHGEASGSGTGLLLSNDPESGLLAMTAEQVENGPRLANLKLAVLSTCSSARGRERGLQDPNNLVQALLRAGAAIVVASRWDVDSGTTSELMTAFYSGIAEGYPVPEALAIAEGRIRTKRSHPFYWAAFSPFGISTQTPHF